MSKRGWLTVDSYPPGTKDIVFRVPDSQDWLSILRGALVPLFDSANYEDFGALSGDDMADYWRDIVLSFFEEVPMIQSGFIMAYAGLVVPDGWLECDGSLLDRTEYPGLYQALGYTYGSLVSNPDLFGIPNLSGRVVVGIDTADDDFDTRGNIGGVKAVALSVAQLPSHTHVQNSHNHVQNSHAHTIPRSTQAYLASGANLGMPGYVGGAYTTPADNQTNATTPTNQASTAVNQNTGGGGSHYNVQPFMALSYLIKV